MTSGACTVPVNPLSRRGNADGSIVLHNVNSHMQGFGRARRQRKYNFSLLH